MSRDEAPPDILALRQHPDRQQGGRGERRQRWSAQREVAQHGER